MLFLLFAVEWLLLPLLLLLLPATGAAAFECVVAAGLMDGTITRKQVLQR